MGFDCPKMKLMLRVMFPFAQNTRFGRRVEHEQRLQVDELDFV